MNYVLGFLPDEKSRYQIGKVIGELGSVFDGQDIDIRWVKPDSYHITLIFLGENINFLKKFSISRRVKGTTLNRFTIQFDRASVGIQKSYRELVYLSLKQGGDEIREILFKLGLWKIRSKDFEVFIPHLTLGRISKMLSDEEYRNLSLDVRNMNKKLEIDKISFPVTELYLMKFDQGNVEIIEKFSLK